MVASSELQTGSEWTSKVQSAKGEKCLVGGGVASCEGGDEQDVCLWLVPPLSFTTSTDAGREL